MQPSVQPAARSSRAPFTWACLAVALTACAHARVPLGEVRIQSGSALADLPEVFGVQKGRIFSSRFDASLGADGCLHGPWVLCPQEAPAPEEPGARRERWAGADGSVVTELAPDGRHLRLEVRLRGAPGVYALVLLGDGPQWDELREHPALLAVAAAAARQSTPLIDKASLLPGRDRRDGLADGSRLARRRQQ